MTTPKTLMAFDFDHTVADGNSDIEVQKLYTSSLPDEIQRLYCVKDGWTDYMAAIFVLLHDNGVQPNDIKENILGISLICGMKELFEHLNNDCYEIIIISDANTLFIDWLLAKHDLSDQVHRVYSNPAEFNKDGKLTIQYYHRQDWCDLSSKNMCKGHILENHIKEREEEGVTFARVCYVGDGNNDYCPSLRLSRNDYVFVRENLGLHRKIKANQSKLKANIVVWKTGSTIHDTLKQLPSAGSASTMSSNAQTE